MKETITYFALCDLYSKCLLSSKNTMLFPDVIPKDFGVDDGTERGVWTTIFNQLYVDGYIKEAMFYMSNENKPTHYTLTSKGRIFIQAGGYGNLFKEQGELKELQKTQITSVIDTNDSVIKTNNKMWVIAGLAALFAFSSAIIAWFQYSKSPDELIQPQLDSIHKSIQSLRVSQEHAIRHLQNALQKDTLNVKVSK